MNIKAIVTTNTSRDTLIGVVSVKPRAECTTVTHFLPKSRKFVTEVYPNNEIISIIDVTNNRRIL